MVESLMQIAVSLLSVVMMGFGSLGTSGATVTAIDIPGPTEAPIVIERPESTEVPIIVERPARTEAPVEAADTARYPNYSLWDMPFGLTVDEVAAIVEEKTGQTPDTDESSLTLYGAEKISFLGYPVDIFAYFSEPYGKEGSGAELSSISFDLNISGKENFGLRQPVPSRDSARQVAAGIIPRIDEIAASAVDEYGPLTDVEVAVWQEEDSEMEYIASPIDPDGTLDTDAMLDIVTTYQTVLFYLYFDNVDVMFYTAFNDDYDGTYYVLSPSVRYSYYDYGY